MQKSHVVIETTFFPQDLSLLAISPYKLSKQKILILFRTFIFHIRNQNFLKIPEFELSPRLLFFRTLSATP